MTTDSFFKSKGYEILSDIRIDQDSCSSIASHLTSTNFVSHSSNYIEFQPGSRRHGDSVIFFLPDAAPDVIDALPLQAISESVVQKTGLQSPYITQFTARNSTIALDAHQDIVYPWIDQCWMVQAIIALSTNKLEDTTFVYPGTHNVSNPVLDRCEKHYSGLQQGQIMLVDSRTYHGADLSATDRWIIVITFSAPWLRPLAHFDRDSAYTQLFGNHISTPALGTKRVSLFHE